jgi:hypothetical protein
MIMPYLSPKAAYSRFELSKYISIQLVRVYREHIERGLLTKEGVVFQPYNTSSAQLSESIWERQGTDVLPNAFNACPITFILI